jgi:hypothetical protein
VGFNARDGTALVWIYYSRDWRTDQLEEKEARCTLNVNCANLGKVLLAALAKVSKGMEKLHWKILFWMYEPDRPQGAA